MKAPIVTAILLAVLLVACAENNSKKQSITTAVYNENGPRVYAKTNTDDLPSASLSLTTEDRNIKEGKNTFN